MVKAIQLEYLLRFSVSCSGNMEEGEGFSMGLSVGCYSSGGQLPHDNTEPKS
jgi:hypothetical protein